MPLKIRVFTLIFGLFWFLGATFKSNSQNQPIKLSDEAKISVITFGPYQGELWSAFGHNGIRVFDPLLDIDWMYDWGRFDFEQANFFWNFARGKMLYSIGRTQKYPNVKSYYIKQNRSIKEQVLNLSQAENQAFFNYLEHNNLPANRTYLYNYVYNNCATKIRDIIQEVVPAAVLDLSFKVPKKSVRDLMDDYLFDQPWGDFIIDVALADPIDDEATAITYLFLPDYVHMALEGGSIENIMDTLPLVKDSITINVMKNKKRSQRTFTPFNTFVILFFIIGYVTNKNFKNKKRTHWIDLFLFSIVGLFGWWFVFLWGATSHLSMYNWNLLWALPIHLPLIFFLNHPRWRKPLSRAYRFIGLLNLLLLLFWALIPQPLHMALIPLILTLVLRSFYISYDLNKTPRQFI
jgi:hypothetical protein